MEFVRFGAVTMIVDVPLCIGLGKAAELRSRFLTSSGGAAVWYVVTTGFGMVAAGVTVTAPTDAINASFCMRVGVVFIRVLAIVYVDYYCCCSCCVCVYAIVYLSL